MELPQRKQQGNKQQFVDLFDLKTLSHCRDSCRKCPALRFTFSYLSHHNFLSFSTNFLPHLALSNSIFHLSLCLPISLYTSFFSIFLSLSAVSPLLYSDYLIFLFGVPLFCKLFCTPHSSSEHVAPKIFVYSLNSYTFCCFSQF